MLIVRVSDDMRMLTFLLVAGLLLVCLLAPFYGADSRVDELARRRRPTH